MAPSSSKVLVDEFKHDFEILGFKSISTHQHFSFSGLSGPKSKFLSWDLRLQPKAITVNVDSNKYDSCLSVTAHNASKQRVVGEIIMKAGYIDPETLKKKSYSESYKTPVDPDDESYAELFLTRKAVEEVHYTFTMKVFADPDEPVVSLLPKNFKWLLDSAEMADVTIKTSDGEIPAHGAILIARSSVFRAMLTTDMQESRTKEIRIQEFDRPIVEGLLEFLYTGSSEKVACMPMEMLKIGDQFDVRDLRDTCASILCAKKVTPENVISNLVIADRYNMEKFKAILMNFFKENLAKIAEQDDFVELAVTNRDLYNEAVRYGKKKP